MDQAEVFEFRNLLNFDLIVVVNGVKDLSNRLAEPAATPQEPELA